MNWSAVSLSSTFSAGQKHGGFARMGGVPNSVMVVLLSCDFRFSCAHFLSRAAARSVAAIPRRQPFDRNAMHCPFCRHDETKVVDSRTSQQFAIRRRRECLECGRRFTTYEKIEESPLKVIKKDGSRVPFDRDKIRFGLEKACYKRPIGDEQIESIISDVEMDLYEDFQREIPSKEIGERLMRALRSIDQVAFVRFASVYREFDDVNDFVRELEPILRGAAR